MQNRLLSLDVFRGMTVAAMILVNNPGDWDHVYAPLLHAHWNGCTPTDLIFPFFLFIVGVSIAFALGSVQPEAHNTVMIKVVKRGAILFGLGVFLSLYPKFDFAHVRIMGVLQRIGLVFIFSSIIFLKTNFKTQIYITVALLLVYYLLMNFVPVPDFGFANLEPETNLGAWFDRTILTTDHLWKTAKVWDPEGLLGTIPATATGLLGVLTGQWLRNSRPVAERLTWLFLAGNALIICGLIVDMVFPINKALWSSSYVLYAGGWAIVWLAACYWLIDVQGYKRWTKPFVVFGVNAITVFFLSGIIPRTLNLFKVAQPDGTEISSQKWLFQSGIAPLFSDPYMASLAGSLTFLSIWTVILWIMFEKKIIVKV
jgi:predicted acyltransferase